MSFEHRTDRLLLRSWRDGDLELWDTWLNVPAVARTTGGLQTREQIAISLDRLQVCEADSGHTFWALERLEDGAFLGFCGIKTLAAPGIARAITGMPEIGWRLREDAWGQSFAREAAIASLQLGFSRFAFDAIYAITLIHNERSWGLMRRLGMTPRPELDFDMPVHGRHVTYSIGREAWMA